MSNEPDDLKPLSPNYFPYSPVVMGMIQPEWMYMSHFYTEEEEEKEVEENETEVQILSATSPTDLAPVKENIRINFRSRTD